MELYFEIMDSYESPRVILQNLLFTLGVLIAAYALIRLIRYQLINRLTDNRKAQLIYRGSSIVITLSSIVGISAIWFSGRQGTVIVFGLVLAVVLLAIKDLVINIAAWFYITLFDVYNIDDRIEINDIIGNVVEVSLLHTRLSEVKGKLLLKQDFTGRDVYIPNRFIFEHTFYNFTNDSKFVWVDAVVHVAFDADYRKALRLAEAIAHEATITAPERYDEEEWQTFTKELESRNKTPEAAVRMQFDPQAIGIYLTFFCRYDEIGSQREYYHFKMFEAFRDNDIALGDVRSIYIENP